MDRFSRWRRMCRELGATKNVRGSFGRIVALYRTPPRFYHTLRHVEHCLNEFDAVRGAVDRPAAVQAALWFHDSVYDSRASDNEDRSGRVAVSMLGTMGVRAVVCESVRKLIRHTQHVRIPGTADGRVVADIDLAILGVPPEVFARYERNIRKEYGWVAEPVFRMKRVEFLRALLGRKRIFLTDYFFGKYEAKARRNMARSVAAMSGCSKEVSRSGGTVPVRS